MDLLYKKSASELYREDLCFLAAEIIEKESVCPTPIDPIV